MNMKTLSETWFTDGYIDFELKKYTLLAYLQEVNRCFNETKLYPQLSDVVFHYNNLISFRNNKQFLQEHFPKKLSGVQLERLQLIYQSMIEDDELMETIESIIHYAIPKMEYSIQTATEIYEAVEDQISIEPVGIVPLDVTEGYLLFQTEKQKETQAYYYRLGIFHKHNERYRSLKTQWIHAWKKSLFTTYEQFKLELVKLRPQMPNPAVYAISCPLKFPMQETLLPVAKRSFVRYLNHAA